jgi:Protein of unknown function (DUF1553)/Protein of unknown function (DUF1549)/Bacterial Ig-like domain (group 2)
MLRFHLTALALLVSLTALPAREEVPSSTSKPSAPKSLRITPATFILQGSDSIQRLLVTGTTTDAGDERDLDYSRKAAYTSSDPQVATVSPDGLVLPHGNGTAKLRATWGRLSASAEVTVLDYDVEKPVSFRNQIVPLFTKLGCNAGGCHGKASGQNGFRLSLLGFDSDFDYAALVKEARGRRLIPAAPANSLLLLKACADAPHGGGRRLLRDSTDYALLLRWIRQGMPAGSDKDPRVTRIECFPKTVVLGHRSEHQILVTAFYSDGFCRDVTQESQYKSNEVAIGSVDRTGMVRTDENTGETAVMARYMGHLDVCRVCMPVAGPSQETSWPVLPVRNYIDELVQARWKKLKLTPSPLADDAVFLRRAFLDGIGTLPTPVEVRAFLDERDPRKREKLVDHLLARSEYADFWALKWGDLLRNQRKGQQSHQRGTYAFHAWIRNAFAANMPYDQFVRNILAAQGTVDQHPPIIWYRTVRNLTHQTNDTAQLFLGTRINCAQCHHHPYEKWGQDDYYQLQAFFARLGRKSGEISDEPAIFVRPDGQVRNPANGKIMQARGLDGPEVRLGEDEDPRQRLVDWMVAADNPFFTRAIANRLWAHFLGRGLVDPVDDMRVTNPPSNPELLDALARDLFDHKFDLKHLIRTIMVSTTYQLSSDPLPGNVHDQQNFARAYPRRLLAEVMLDAINHVAGTAENFPGMPKNTRAIQLPDESVGSYFLDVFGRPGRETPCECERPREANLAQALHLLNSTDVQAKVSAPAGRLARLLKEQRSDEAMVEELYLLALARPPSADEGKKVLAYLRDQTDRKAALQDVLWALLNTKEFLFNH